MREDYAGFVEHPRFGRGPRVTGENPQTDLKASPTVYLHWHSSERSRVPGTAVAADLRRQAPAMLAVTHYYDVKRTCRDCRKRFLFFAEEQKYWYEKLKLPLEADCVRCVHCRRAHRGIVAKRERYEELFGVAERSVDEDLELLECSLALIEQGLFHQNQLERVRALLRRLPDGLTPAQATRRDELSAWQQRQAGGRDPT